MRSRGLILVEHLGARNVAVSRMKSRIGNAVAQVKRAEIQSWAWGQMRKSNFKSTVTSFTFRRTTTSSREASVGSRELFSLKKASNFSWSKIPPVSHWDCRSFSLAWSGPQISTLPRRYCFCWSRMMMSEMVPESSSISV